jgi:alpha-aminoadipate/glutamate carrier protein LysW
MTASCPECSSHVSIPGGSHVNEILTCDECASELELVALAPPLLALAPEVEEDWGE